MRVFAGCLLLCPLLLAEKPVVRTTTLDNGMKLLIEEDHNIPNVAMYFFYKIGSRNEKPGTTGVSHFFEHMMFNGAKKFGPKQFDNEMEKAGGNNNASTGKDLTTYTDWFPSTALNLMMEMEADRIRDLAFDHKIIESERGVVYSERRTSVDNNNFGTLSEQVYAAAYTAHPYHWPVVGWPSDIEGWTLDDLKSHFRMGYAPSNCTMVVVGDVAADRVIALAKQYLEPIPSHDPPPPVRTQEPAQQGERRVVVHKAAQLPLQMIAYHVPEAKHPDSTVLEVIQALLVRGQSSRLYKRMQDEEQLVLSVNVNLPATIDPGLIVFVLQPRSGVDPARTEKVLFEQLERLQSAPPPPEELRKAQNQILVEHYRQLKTIAGRASLLGYYETVYGSYAKLFDREKDLEAVTAEDVQRVSKKYFTERNRTVGTLVPEAKGAAR